MPTAPAVRRDRRDVVRLVHTVGEHGEVGLAALERAAGLANRSGVIGAVLTRLRWGLAALAVHPPPWEHGGSSAVRGVLPISSVAHVECAAWTRNAPIVARY